MQSSTRSSARVVTAVVGLSAVASALLFERMPGRAADAVRLPARPALGRAIAARDLTVGLLLLVPAAQPTALALRAASDALDVSLMASEVLRGRRTLAATALFMLGGAALCALSLGLRRRLEA